MSRYPDPNYGGSIPNPPQQGSIGTPYGQNAVGPDMTMAQPPMQPQGTSLLHQRPLPPEASAGLQQQQPPMYQPQADVNSIASGMSNIGLQDSSAPQNYPAPAQPYPAPEQPYGASTQPYGASTQPYGTSTQPYDASTQPYGAPAQPYGASDYGGQRPAAYGAPATYQQGQAPGMPSLEPQMYPQQPQEPLGSPAVGEPALPRPTAIEPACGSKREIYNSVADGSAPGVGPPPASRNDFIGVDTGSCTPRFMRLTVNSIPVDSSMQGTSSIPLGLILTPFADPEPGEAPVLDVDLTTAGGGGPLRCPKCNGYANPGFRFVDSGNKFYCNLCGQENDTPSEHMCATNPANGLRLDIDYRHEFRYGSVDYIVGNKDYFATDPTPPHFVVCVDVSASGISTGLAAVAVQSVQSILEANALPGGSSGAKIGIITYDQSLHFYDGRGDGQARVQYVPDTSDPFIPIGPEAFFQPPERAISVIEMISNTFSLMDPSQLKGGPPPSGNALGAAVVAAKQALSEIGGKVFVVTGGIPSVGSGKLERRGGGSVSSEEREKALLKDETPFYDDLGSQMAELQISVDMVIATQQPYVDAASLLRLPRASGGRGFLLTNFDYRKDDVSVRKILVNAIWGVRALDAMVKVRASKGLETGEYMGSFGRPQRRNDVIAPVMGVDSVMALELKHDGQIQTNLGGGSMMSSSAFANNVCIQCAILYTDLAGRRRIRVHTMFPPKTTVLQDTFRSADLDAVVAIMCMRAANAAFSGSRVLSKVREALIEKTAHILFVYRKFCNPPKSQSTKLVLPETLKLLPVMILGILKSAAFRPQPSGQNLGVVSTDERAAALLFLSTARPQDITTFAYPRMVLLSQLDEFAGFPRTPQDGFPPEGEPIALPASVPLSSEFLADERMFLVDNGLRLVLWYGKSCSSELLQEIFDTSTGVYRLRLGEEGQGEIAMRISAIITRILESKSNLTQVIVAPSGSSDGAEQNQYLPLLIEDKNIALAQSGWSYKEFLKVAHRRIMDKMAQERAQKDFQAWEMLGYQ
uniref:Protein transport protein SEC24 n=1 Tax=Rhodosorus marinus TaxID=101924 RepID=A0A7S2ZA94_9RHOD|mmetsp:Transcript_10698/g.44557  ORF Transcript_10698/g.44557 Transcript_10698/m.44557 type:complete len:1035 (+) Transcript_10698:352-3456(+)